MVHIDQSTLTFSADTVTPVSIYLRLRDAFPGAVLLEGADQQPGEEEFSFIAIMPCAEFRVLKREVHCSFPDGERTCDEIVERGDVLSRLSQFMASFSFSGEELPSGHAGLYGYSSFNCIAHFEDIDLVEDAEQRRAIPDMLYRYFRFVIAFNHYHNRITIIENAPKNVFTDLKKEHLKYQILHRDYTAYDFEKHGEENSNLTEDEHVEMIETCKKHIQRGDVFQIVPSRRFEQQYRGDDFMVYRALRSINPSPYMFYFDFDDFHLFGSSPEANLVVNENVARLYPIAGTYKRTGDKSVDEQKVTELLADEKENAEHVMLVDLARNDLSRFCTAVEVESYKTIKQYSHVIHITSVVRGTLPDQKDSLKLFAATFPMGTLSGAPKYRALEILGEVEKGRREAYGGAAGVIGFDGSINHAIIIRSFVAKGSVLYYQGGGGVVADSDPRAEVCEVENKLGALRAAMKLAEEELL